MSRKISIIGSSCSGKTTLAAQLAERLGVPHLELDALHHGPNWQEATADELRAKVEEALTGLDGWVADGNYMGKLGTLVIDRADTIVWLDLPLRTPLPADLAPNPRQATRPRSALERGQLRDVARVVATHDVHDPHAPPSEAFLAATLRGQDRRALVLVGRSRRLACERSGLGCAEAAFARTARLDRAEHLHDLWVELRARAATELGERLLARRLGNRYGRCEVIAENASQTAMIRAASGISVPASPSG